MKNSVGATARGGVDKPYSLAKNAKEKQQRKARRRNLRHRKH